MTNQTQLPVAQISNAQRSEREKMLAGESYNCLDEELFAQVARARRLCAQLTSLTVHDPGYRAIIRELIPSIPDSTVICPPFHCDYGSNILLGEHVFFNYNCCVLDPGLVRIGDYTLLGPHCQLYTPQHPLDWQERQTSYETAEPITIGANCWLGGGVVVCPGVTIGERCVIGAGSVVSRDIPSDSLAVGNPARVIRSLR